MSLCEKQDVFKVVTLTPTKLISAWVSQTYPFCVRYEVGRWTRPYKKALEQGYGLLVFEKELQAVWFMENVCPWPTLRLFAAKSRKPMVLPVMSPVTWDMFEEGKGWPKNRCKAKWPPGTLMFEEVMLLEEVGHG